MKKWLLGASAVVLLCGQETRLSDVDAVLAHISAESLRGNVSFLSSDALEGRATPSRGLDVAAEFLASRFRAAGLEPIGPNDSYFQEAKFLEIRPKLDDVKVTLASEGNELTLDKEAASVRSVVALEVKDAEVVILPEDGNAPDIAGPTISAMTGCPASRADA